MSMLAEKSKKSKLKLFIYPKESSWSSDENKFGQKLLEKMGWSKGKGLGKENQGNAEPVKAFFKDNSKGIGYKEKGEEWVKNVDAFEDVLSNLSTISNPDSSPTKNVLTSESNNVESLEEKSKNSKNRVHYHKFTKGKDLSLYKEDDLASILGTKKNLKNKLLEKEIASTEVNLPNVGEMYHSHGLTTIHGGNLKEYFNKRMTELKKKRNEGLLGNNDGEFDSSAVHDYSIPDFSFEPAKTEFSFNITEHEPESLELENENIESTDVPKLKKKKKDKKKNKREVNDKDIFKNSENSFERLTTEKKKKRKRGCEQDESEETENCFNKENEDTSLLENLNTMGENEKLKKKKTKRKRSCEQDESEETENCFNKENEDTSLLENLNTTRENEKLKKKKKKKKCNDDGEDLASKDKREFHESNEEKDGLRKMKKKKKNDLDFEHELQDGTKIKTSPLENKDFDEGCEEFKKKTVSDCEQNEGQDEIQFSGTVLKKEKKKKKKETEFSGEQNKIQENERDINGVIEISLSENEVHERLKKKKKKNKAGSDSDKEELQDNKKIREDIFKDSEYLKKEKKKKKSTKSNCEEEFNENCPVGNDSIAEVQEEFKKEKKKKKKKTEFSCEEDEMREKESNLYKGIDGSDLPRNEIAIKDEEEIKKEKKKKKKMSDTHCEPNELQENKSEDKISEEDFEEERKRREKMERKEKRKEKKNKLMEIKENINEHCEIFKKDKKKKKDKHNREYNEVPVEANSEREMEGDLNHSYITANFHEKLDKKRNNESSDEKELSQRPLKKIRSLTSEVKLGNLFNEKEGSSTKESNLNEGEHESNNDNKKSSSKIFRIKSFKEAKRDLEEKIRNKINKENKSTALPEISETKENPDNDKIKQLFPGTNLYEIKGYD